MVDWSAASQPTRGRDSIWIAHSARVEAVNCAHRSEAYALLCEYFHEAVRKKWRVLCAFDICFGFPRGAIPALRSALVVQGKDLAHWHWLWGFLAEQVQDDMNGKVNRNNRFDLANYINSLILGQRKGDGQYEYGPFWGLPASCTQSYPHLAPHAQGRNPIIRERRYTEELNRSMTIWQLCYPGAVGGQSLLGIPYLYRLRFLEGFSPLVRVWPFDTDWQDARIVLAETYFSLIPRSSAAIPKDRAQVESAVAHCLRLQEEGGLGKYFYTFSEANFAERHQAILSEEGWTLFQSAG